jgi:hypothetical protein
MGDLHCVSAWDSLRTLFEDGTVTGLTDPQLLELFVARRSEAAFAAIVERHGPMVQRVCHEVVLTRYGQPTPMTRAQTIGDRSFRTASLRRSPSLPS